MYTYSELERIASTGGYTADARSISRITAVQVQQLHAGLANSGSDEAGTAIVALTKLRRWLLLGGTEPPPVRGAGYVRGDREVWIAYTNYESPLLVRGRGSTLSELGQYLEVAASPHYDGSLRVRTDPPIQLASQDGVVLQSRYGNLTINPQAALIVQQWLSVTIQRNDRRGVLCLPGVWSTD